MNGFIFNTLTSLRLRLFVNRLQKLDALPPHIEVAHIHSTIHMCSAYYSKRQEIISESIATACASPPELAVIKALTELLERKAFEEASMNGLGIAQSERSDGCTGYPILLIPEFIAKRRARVNALAEAFERYVWSEWWDNREIAFKVRKIALDENSSFLTAILNLAHVNAFYEIEPVCENSLGLSLIILVAEFQGGGFASGGAAGVKGDEITLKFRAENELYRHVLALNRMKEERHKPSSFYQRRLFYFGSGEGDHLIRSRLACNGRQSVRLPNLAIDSEIPYEYSKLVYVHRCQFDKQRPFIGGKLERFCI